MSSRLFDPVSLLRPAIRNFKPFSSARKESGGVARTTEIVRLDANENPWAPLDEFGVRCKANRYPEPQPEEIREILSGLYGLPADHILLSRGSDELPDLLIRCFCQPTKEGIVICPPTFPIYEVAASLNESPIRRIPLRAAHGYDLDVDAILKNWQPQEKLIIIPSPNAPMGHMMPREQIKALLDGLKERAIVVVDEAYIEFSDHASWAKELAHYPHLVVMRTLSKGYGLAGVRLGVLLGAPSLIAILGGVLPPYAIAATTIELVRQTLNTKGLALMKEHRAILLKERARVASALARCPDIKIVYPSEGNFLLVGTRDAAAMVARCREAGIFVRNRHADLPEAVRITIGLPAENDRLLAILGVAAVAA
jgi:histidinol-phosphate aminotransferase